MQFPENYASVGLIPFNFKLSAGKDGKKKLGEMPAHSTITETNYKKFINKNMSGHAIRTGTLLPKLNESDTNDRYLILLDIDDKSEKKGKYISHNGVRKWKQILSELNLDILDFDTPIQTTANNGYHYFFAVSKSQLDAIGTITGIWSDGELYSIDVKGQNQIAIVEPSGYNFKRYTFIKHPKTTSVSNIPEWLYELIINGKSNSPQQLRQLTQINTTNTQDHKKQNPNDKSIVYHLISCLSNDRVEHQTEWVKLGALIYASFNLSDGYDVFLGLSKRSSKFQSPNYVLKQWKYYEKSKTCYSDANSALLTLKSWAYADNAQMFFQIMNSDANDKEIEHMFNSVSSDKQIEVFELNKRYLISNNDAETDEVYQYVQKFYENEQILAILSPYNTGKTQLIKKLLTSYKNIHV